MGCNRAQTRREGTQKNPIHLVGEKRAAMVELVLEWEAQGKVESGQGEWSSPDFVVPKKNRKWRGVVDFRALNEATVGDSQPFNTDRGHFGPTRG